MKRKVLSLETRIINYQGIGAVKVRIAVWCMPIEETSRSYKATDFGITIFGKGVHSSERRSFRKVVCISKSDPISSLDSLMHKHWGAYKQTIQSLIETTFKGCRDFHGYTTALYCKVLGGKRLEGAVVYANTDDHYNGVIDTSIGRVTYYRCNFKGANSPYASLVSNIEVDRDSKVSFEIPSDPYMFHAIGVINLEVVKTEPKESVA